MRRVVGELTNTILVQTLRGLLKKYCVCTIATALRHIIIQPTCRGRPVCLPLSTVLHDTNRLRRMVLVSINWMDECINIVQIRHNHPVRLRLPPLQRRGMYRPHSSWILFQQSHFGNHLVGLLSPQEGNKSSGATADSIYYDYASV